ncbi:SRPBCC family protein [Kineococcus sp. TRM81007]|uniref:SRPBCC family protein n=1 Tax=Kineococcus sp. TRM81007 TaxID=2925831 RepID=UPI001F591B4C|nr:SRPBCC family protein [Kineococcus sp. TRM81007]MCI2238403.1 SRPBCC family protein [Kineococcus sp. TRM81007]
MSTVSATTTRRIDAPAEQVLAALADYNGTRPRLLPEQFSDYAVLSGGIGPGTQVRWKLHATKKRVRDVLADVSSTDAHALVEKDRNSSLVTTWRVEADGPDAAEVVVTNEWQGAGGVGGFFERTFAPRGLDRIYGELLDNLAVDVAR